jgi:NIMA (never in mitosis gene a)-related kinase
VAETLAQRQAELESLASRRVAEREAELRDAVMRKEEEVRDRMEKREAELLQAVMQREEQLRQLWEEYEMGLRQELRSREEEVQKAEEYLKGEWEQLQLQKASIEAPPACVQSFFCWLYLTIRILYMQSIACASTASR